MDPFKDDNEIVTLDIGKRIQRLRSTSRVNGGIDISDEASLALQCMMEKDWIDRTRPRDILLLPFFHR